MEHNPQAAGATSAVSIGENPDNLDIGVANVKGCVVMRFDKLVQWFALEPRLAMDIAAALIAAAEAAADERKPPIVAPPPKKIIIPGLPS